MARVTGHLDVEPGIAAILMQQRRALLLGLEYLLGASRQLVPIEEGTLERSGHIVMENDTRGAVVYDTPYAVRQHEELDYRHAPGRQAKYLEQPMNTDRDTIWALISAELQRAWR